MTESDLTNPAKMAKGIMGKFWLLVEDVYPTARRVVHSQRHMNMMWLSHLWDIWKQLSVSVVIPVGSAPFTHQYATTASR